MEEMEEEMEKEEMEEEQASESGPSEVDSEEELGRGRRGAKGKKGKENRAGRGGRVTRAGQGAKGKGREYHEVENHPQVKRLTIKKVRRCRPTVEIRRSRSPQNMRRAASVASGPFLCEDVFKQSGPCVTKSSLRIVQRMNQQG
eukprot:74591-Pyramimonas_sp.AAC.1